VSSTRRLLVWASFFPPHVGGYEKNVLELSRRLVERGYQVDVITCQLGDSLAIEAIDGVGVRRVPSPLLLDGQYPVPLPSKMLLSVLTRKHDYDVVITQTRFFALSFVGAVFSALHGLPLVHVERGSRHTVVANLAINLISKAYDHSIGSWIMRSAERVVGVSGAACNFAKHLGARETIRISNGIVDNGSVVSTADSILYVGRLIRAKGVQDLIEAHKRLGGRLPLAIVGDGPYRRQLREIAGSSNSIQFLGELSGKQLDDVYRSARIFVNPSYSEGLPTAVMEAASFGIPVIATSVGGTEEIIQAGTTGLLIEPGNVDDLERSISWTLKHKEATQRMAKACRKRVLELFSWNEITNQYCRLLEDLKGGE